MCMLFALYHYTGNSDCSWKLCDKFSRNTMVRTSYFFLKIMLKTVCTWPTTRVGFLFFILLVHWTNSPKVDMFPHSQPNTLLLLHNAACLNGEAPNTNFIDFGLKWSGIQNSKIIYQYLKKDNSFNNFVI